MAARERACERMRESTQEQIRAKRITLRITLQIYRLFATKKITVLSRLRGCRERCGGRASASDRRRGSGPGAAARRHRLGVRPVAARPRQPRVARGWARSRVGGGRWRRRRRRWWRRWRDAGASGSGASPHRRAATAAEGASRTRFRTRSRTRSPHAVLCVVHRRQVVPTSVEELRSFVNGLTLSESSDEGKGYTHVPGLSDVYQVRLLIF